MAKINKILIVCTGNSCRSPMAEALLKELFSDDKDVFITSSGIGAINGTPPSPFAIEVIKKEEGIDISDYCTKRFTRYITKQADLILVMSLEHKEFIAKNIPGTKDKIFLLRELAGIETANDMNVFDPIGQPYEAYKKTYGQIKEAINKIYEKIKVYNKDNKWI